MAEERKYDCDHCGRSIRAWSDGNPYYVGASGKKQYAYHPDHERLNLCVGNDLEHLCLGCGLEFCVDSEAPVEVCDECGSRDFVPCFELEGKPCPYCRTGHFRQDPTYYVIS